MKFTAGLWDSRPEFEMLYAVQVDDVRVDEAAGTLTVYATTKPVTVRGGTLNQPLLTITFSSRAEGVITTRAVHFAGRRDRGPHFELAWDDAFRPQVELTDDAGILRSGDLEVRVPRSGPWKAEYLQGGEALTTAAWRSLAAVQSRTGAGEWMRQQLSVEPDESVYGLGERFGPFVKNGQVVDSWNADGGTSSEQAYKNLPFYVTSRGYGVLVDHSEKVSFEVCSEMNSRAQFSVAGSSLTYHVFGGPTLKDVLRRYTAVSGRAPQVPAWSLGLWLTTSFTTDYDEATVASFIDGMAERDLPLSVFHFDCFWMREYQWCDFEWDPRTFPDPEGMLARLKERGVRICVWINPYIGQRSKLFAEAADQGFLVATTDGDVWQWDLWQAGMGLIDFTNPSAVEWWKSKLRGLVDQGVDAFKTDFGERVPVDGIRWHDGSDPQKMHNYYTQLYNRATYEVLEEAYGRDQAVLFARSATVGGQSFPVHWGGDSIASYASMAESLRGGLSLMLGGFGYWSHDIGGFGGNPDPAIFKRWTAFGLLSSHSRLHGSGSYRVPWAYDDEAVHVMRRFTKLKMSLMPYLGRIAAEVTEQGLPMMRPMVLEYPEDRGARDCDLQYMFGDSLLVSPVFRADGTAQTYLPAGRWTHLLDGTVHEGGRWIEQRYDIDDIGLFVRPGTVLPVGEVDDRPEYAWAEGVTLRLFELPDGHDTMTHVPAGAGEAASFRVRREGDRILVTSGDARVWAIARGTGPVLAAHTGPGTLEISCE